MQARIFGLNNSSIEAQRSGLMRTELMRRSAALGVAAFFSVSILVSNAAPVESQPVAASVSKPVPKHAAQVESIEVSKPEPVALAKPVQQGSAASERLEILQSERKRILTRLEAAKTDDEETRFRADLSAIEREISLAMRSAGGTSPAKQNSAPVAKKSAAPQFSANQTAVNASTTPANFESWDIFKNFGTRGN